MEHELLIPQEEALVLIRTLTLQTVKFECWPSFEPSEEPMVFVRVARADAWRTRGFDERRAHLRPSPDRTKSKP